jgi:hypothetical protein
MFGKIAIALGYKAGDFTNVPVPLGIEATVESLEHSLKQFEGHIWIDVSLVRSQRHVRNFGACHTYMIDTGRLKVDVTSEINQLAEWLDLTVFLTCDEIQRTDRERRRIERRRLYTRVLAQVHEIERRAHSRWLSAAHTRPRRIIPIYGRRELPSSASFQE